MKTTQSLSVFLAALLAASLAPSAFAAKGKALDKAKASADGAAAGLTEDDLSATKTWQGKIGAGFDTRSGNTEKDAASVHAEARKLQGDWIVLADFDYAWERVEETAEDGTSKDKDTVDSLGGAIDVKRRLPGCFVYGAVTGERDRIADLNYRFVESLGLGTFLIDRDTLKFSVQAGLAYVQEEYDAPAATEENPDPKSESDDYLAYQASERIDWIPTWAEGVSFFEAASYLCSFDESDDYLVNAEAGVDIPMFLGLSLTFKGVVEYDNTPAAGKERCDRQLATQVSYNF